jgi:type I restriction enzyme S subunit
MTAESYALPPGWRWVRLGEVARLERKTLMPAHFPNQMFRYLGMEQVEAGQWDEPSPLSLPGSKIRSQVVVFRPGLVLYGRLRPYLNKVVVPSSDGVASSEFVPIHPDNVQLTPEYLGAYLRSPHFVTYAQRNTTGSRQPRVRLDAIWQASIPLPPLDEQRRIVAQVEALMERVREARRLRAQARADADQLMQAALAQIFPRPGTELPPGWRWVRLGEVAIVRYGKANPRRPGQIPVIGSGGVFDSTDAPLVCHPTVIIGRKGSAGKVLVIDEPCWPSDTTFYLDWRTEIEPEWVAGWLKLRKPSPEGTTATLPSLRRQDLEQLLLPFPPLDEQRRIVAYLDQVHEQVRAIITAQEASEVELLQLEQAILHRAFRGEL